MYANLLLSSGLLVLSILVINSSDDPQSCAKEKSTGVETGLKNDCACVWSSRLVPLFDHLIMKGYRYDNLTVAGDFQEIITLQNGTGRNLRTAAIKGKSLTCRSYLEEMLAI